MQIVITTIGNAKCLYGEDLDLHALGQLEIQRGSHVEPTDDGCWTADLSPVNGPHLGPFPCRSKALRAEREWLERNWLDTAVSDHLPQSTQLNGEPDALDLSEDC